MSAVKDAATDVIHTLAGRGCANDIYELLTSKAIEHEADYEVMMPLVLEALSEAVQYIEDRTDV